MSNDTYLTVADWGRGPQGIVLRLEPEERRLFPRYDLDAQVSVLRALAEGSDVPVPRVLWHEPDPSVLGRSFYVMERVEGRIPPDGHLFGGWVQELAPADQTRVLDGALDVLSRIHHVDPETPGLAVLERPGSHASPLDAELAWWRAYLDWATDGERLGLLEAAYAWCAEQRPSAGERTLVWGDARLGNLVYGDDLRPVAVLDWEMATLGPGALDLGWYLFLERTARQFAPQLPGFPPPAGTIAVYERHHGGAVQDIRWYEAWGGFRAACIQVRLAEDHAAREHNPVTKALRALIC